MTATQTIVTTFMFQSESNPKKMYRTLQYADGTTSCDCKSWIYKMRVKPDGSRTCKHTELVETGRARQCADEVIDACTTPKNRMTPRRTMGSDENPATFEGERDFDFS